MIDSQEKGLVCKLLARQKRTHRIFERLIAYTALRLRRTEVEDFNFSEFEMTTASGHLNKFEPAPGKLDSKVGLLCIRFHLLNPKQRFPSHSYERYHRHLSQSIAQNR